MRFSSFWVSGGPPNFLVAATGLVDLTCHVCSTGLPSPKCLPAPRVLEEETQQPSLTHSDVASSKTASSKKKKKNPPHLVSQAQLQPGIPPAGRQRSRGAVHQSRAHEAGVRDEDKSATAAGGQGIEELGVQVAAETKGVNLRDFGEIPVDVPEVWMGVVIL